MADVAGQSTAFRSLELSCNSFTDNRESVYFDNISWYGHGHVARSIKDPRLVFNRLFAVKEHKANASVLDLVLADVCAGRIPGYQTGTFCVGGTPPNPPTGISRPELGGSEITIDPFVDPWGPFWILLGRF